MTESTVRAFHYTRLFDFEVADIQENGIVVSTQQSLRSRLDMLVENAILAREESDVLFQYNLFSCQQARSGKFWLTRCRYRPDDAAVRELVNNWGGEVANCTSDSELAIRLNRLSQQRILVCDVPVEMIDGGSPPDLYISQSLGCESIIHVHSSSDANFADFHVCY